MIEHYPIFLSGISVSVVLNANTGFLLNLSQNKTIITVDAHV